ncbi:MAG: hypothetical protein H3C54_10060 [Taibaiella sp.]|nr:hypothetical protein [Taibaiella sp.]
MRKAFLLLAAYAVVFAGCKKSVDETLDEAFEEYILGGLYENSMGLQIEIDNDQAVIAGFTRSSHSLNQDPSTITIGDTYIRNIKKTGTDKWEGEVVKTKLNMLTQKLSITGWENTVITVNGSRAGIELSNTHDMAIEGRFTGGGNGGGNGSTTDTVYKQQLSGKTYEQVPITYTPPAGTKSMTIRSTEASSADINTADMFVRKGLAPKIVHTYPPNVSSYPIARMRYIQLPTRPAPTTLRCMGTTIIFTQR